MRIIVVQFKFSACCQEGVRVLTFDIFSLHLISNLFILSLGCPEPMIPALIGMPRCTTIAQKCRGHSMLMLLGFVMPGIHAGWFAYSRDII